MKKQLFTIKTKKLVPSTKEWYCILCNDVNIAIRKNRFEFEVNYDEIVSPTADVWFLVSFTFYKNLKNKEALWRTDGNPDTDAIVTNGEEYFLINTSLVSPKRRVTRFILHEQAKTEIDKNISEFVRKIN